VSTNFAISELLTPPPAPPFELLISLPLEPHTSRHTGTNGSALGWVFTYSKWQRRGVELLRAQPGSGCWPLRGAFTLRAFFFVDSRDASTRGGDVALYYDALLGLLEKGGVIASRRQVHSLEFATVIRLAAPGRIEFVLRAAPLH
jgi:hypothetical protein